jgi:hypothetical protein
VSPENFDVISDDGRNEYLSTITEDDNMLKMGDIESTDSSLRTDSSAESSLILDSDRLTESAIKEELESYIREKALSEFRKSLFQNSFNNRSDDLNETMTQIDSDSDEMKSLKGLNSVHNESEGFDNETHHEKHSEYELLKSDQRNKLLASPIELFDGHIEHKSKEKFVTSSTRSSIQLTNNTINLNTSFAKKPLIPKVESGTQKVFTTTLTTKLLFSNYASNSFTTPKSKIIFSKSFARISKIPTKFAKKTMKQETTQLRMGFTTDLTENTQLVEESIESLAEEISIGMKNSSNESNEKNSGILNPNLTLITTESSKLQTDKYEDLENSQNFTEFIENLTQDIDDQNTVTDLIPTSTENDLDSCQAVCLNNSDFMDFKVCLNEKYFKKN